MKFIERFNGQDQQDGTWTFELDSSLNGGFGGANGGVLSALSVYVARQLNTELQATSIDTRFIRGFRPGTATVTPTILNQGRTITVVSVDITSSEGKLCTHSTVTLVTPSALSEHCDAPMVAPENLKPVAEGKVWPQPKGPQEIPLIDTFQPSFVGAGDFGTATATQVIWQQDDTSAEAACIAADISVGPPVARAVRGKAMIPNPDVSLRFCNNQAVGSHLVGTCRLDHLANGVATTGIAVFNGDTLLATGISTTTCMPLPGKPKKETANNAEAKA